MHSGLLDLQSRPTAAPGQAAQPAPARLGSDSDEVVQQVGFQGLVAELQVKGPQCWESSLAGLL